MARLVPAGTYDTTITVPGEPTPRPIRILLRPGGDRRQAIVELELGPVPSPPPKPPTVPSAPPKSVGILSPNDTTRQTPPGDLLELRPVGLPPVGSTYVEPLHGTTVRRVAGGGAMHEYSQLSAISPDGAYVLILRPGFVHEVCRWPSMALVQREPPEGWGAPRWVPGGGHRLLFLRGQPARVLTLDVERVAALDVASSFPEPFLRLGKTHEEVSADGRYTIAWRYTDATRPAEDKITVVDLIARKEVVTFTLAQLGAASEDAINFVAVSPSGKHVAIQWNAAGTGPQQGLQLYDLQTGIRSHQLYARGDHGDWGIGEDGRDYYVTSDQSGGSKQNNNYPPLLALYLDGSPPHEIRMLEWGGFGHVSCRGPRGYALVDGIRFGSRDAPPEIALIRVTTGEARRLAFVRDSRGAAAQSCAVIHPNGTVIWDSDFGGGPGSVFAISHP